MLAVALPSPQGMESSSSASSSPSSYSPSPSILRSLTSRYTDYIADALAMLPDPFLLTDPSLPGHPIVFASPAFLRASGYSSDDLLGRNPRIFQGPATDRRSVITIREAVRGERPVQIAILNYHKDGAERWLFFHMFPVFAQEDGGVAHFVSVHVPIDGRRRRRTMEEVVVLGNCRGDLCGERRGRATDCRFFDTDNRVLEVEQLCDASEDEKEKAMIAANSILSMLTRYSELTGRRVSGKRNNVASVAPLNSSLIISLGRIKESFVLTNAILTDMPIVYASDAFLERTGYAKDEVIGRNCRFLNGSATDVETLDQIGECVRAARNCSVRILIYRKDGSPFWNLLHVSPLRNATGKIAFYMWAFADECNKKGVQGLSPEMKQLGAVGAVKVAVRSMASRADS